MNLDHLTHFKRRNGALYCEGVSVDKLVREHGSPLYIYSQSAFEDQFRSLARAFAPVKPVICFSVKCNGTQAILEVLVRRGAGLDVVSGGELFKALRAGCPPERIVYASVGKTPAEIRMALDAGILSFNVESAAELELINRIALQTGRKAPVALRLNPDVDAKTHKHITTGVKESKFGIDAATVLTILENHDAFEGVRFLGLHMHIGSQITTIRPFVEAVRKAGEVIRQARAYGLPMEWLNLGGGLGIVYKDERPKGPEAYAEAVIPLLRRIGVKLILEPGRFIAGNSGILATEVLYVKQAGRRQLAVVDAGMNDLMRPALYEAYHGVTPLKQARGKERYDIVGPICESADVFARDRVLGYVEPGTRLALLGAGAYGSTMASNYNGRPRPAEILVKGARAAVIRKRETFDDLVRQDSGAGLDG